MRGYTVDHCSKCNGKIYPRDIFYFVRRAKLTIEDEYGAREKRASFFGGSNKKDFGALCVECWQKVIY